MTANFGRIRRREHLSPSCQLLFRLHLPQSRISTLVRWLLDLTACFMYRMPQILQPKGISKASHRVTIQIKGALRTSLSVTYKTAMYLLTDLKVWSLARTETFMSQVSAPIRAIPTRS